MIKDEDGSDCETKCDENVIIETDHDSDSEIVGSESEDSENESENTVTVPSVASSTLPNNYYGKNRYKWSL